MAGLNERDCCISGYVIKTFQAFGDLFQVACADKRLGPLSINIGKFRKIFCKKGFGMHLNEKRPVTPISVDAVSSMNARKSI